MNLGNQPKPLVIDASVAVKWVVAEENESRQADALLEASLRGKWRLVGPPLLLIEATNAHLPAMPAERSPR